MKNIHTAQITIGSHDQIMIGDYDRQGVIEEARRLGRRYGRSVRFETMAIKNPSGLGRG